MVEDELTKLREAIARMQYESRRRRNDLLEQETRRILYNSTTVRSSVGVPDIWARQLEEEMRQTLFGRVVDAEVVEPRGTSYKPSSCRDLDMEPREAAPIPVRAPELDL